MTGVETFNNACLAHLRGQMRASALFLICLMLLLMPCLTDLAPDLIVVEMEDTDTINWSENHDDFIEDFIDIKMVGEKREQILLTFILCSQIPMRCSFSSTLVGLHGTMRTKLQEATELVGCSHPQQNNQTNL